MGSLLPVEYVKEEDIWACPYCGAEVEKWEEECWNCNKGFAVTEEEFDEEGYEPEDGFDEDFCEDKPVKKAANAKGSKTASRGNLRGAQNKQPAKKNSGNRGNDRQAASNRQASKGRSAQSKKSSNKKGSTLNLLLMIVGVLLVGALAFTGFKYMKMKQAEKLMNAGMQQAGVVQQTDMPVDMQQTDMVQIEQ